MNAIPSNTFPTNTFSVNTSQANTPPVVDQMAQPSALETITHTPLSPEMLRRMHACWRAANFLTVGRIYHWSCVERHKLYLADHGEDLPEILNWRWTS